MAFNKLSNRDIYYFAPRSRSCVLLVKCGHNSKYGCILHQLSVPKDLIGKRVMLKLEILDEAKGED